MAHTCSTAHNDNNDSWHRTRRADVNAPSTRSLTHSPEPSPAAQSTFANPGRGEDGRPSSVACGQSLLLQSTDLLLGRAAALRSPTPRVVGGVAIEVVRIGRVGRSLCLFREKALG